jgi:hypothetical protein
MSAKKIEIDWKRVDKLLQAHCHGVGIAGLLGINENTLYSRCRSDLGEEFEAKKQQKQAEGKELLRAKQFELAMMGNVPMAIWLGKNLLGQRDQVEQTVNLPKIVLQPFDKDDLGIIKEAFDFLEKSETTN